jgi:hypothetical protein
MFKLCLPPAVPSIFSLKDKEIVYYEWGSSPAFKEIFLKENAS